jgi:hypothetical protein
VESRPQLFYALLICLPVEVYAAGLGHLQREAAEAASVLLADQAVGLMIDRLPLRNGANIVTFGERLTSDPQSWTAILRVMLKMRRGAAKISMTICELAREGSPDEFSTNGLILEESIPRCGVTIGANRDHADNCNLRDLSVGCSPIATGSPRVPIYTR